MEANAVTSASLLILQALLPIVAMLAMWGARKLILAFEAKSKIDVPQRIEDMINDWVSEGINFAEEQARKAITNKTATITGPEKLEKATDYVLDLIKRYKLDEKAGTWVREKVQAKIEATLPSTRSPA